MKLSNICKFLSYRQHIDQVIMAAFAFPDKFCAGKYTAVTPYDKQTTLIIIQALSAGNPIFATPTHNFIVDSNSIRQFGKASGHSREVIIRKSLRPVALILALYPGIVEQPNQCEFLFNKLMKNEMVMRICFPGMFPDEVANSCDLVISNMMKVDGFFEALISRDVNKLDEIARISEEMVACEVRKFLN